SGQRWTLSTLRTRTHWLLGAWGSPSGGSQAEYLPFSMIEEAIGKYMTRPGKYLVIFSAIAMHALTPARRSLLYATWSAGLAAARFPDCGNSVKMTPSTPFPGVSMVETARRSRAVYCTGSCSALGVVGPYWS